LTRAFFARLLGDGLIVLADRRKGRLRTFLLNLSQRFVANLPDHATAAERGAVGRCCFLKKLGRSSDAFSPSNPSRTRQSPKASEWREKPNKLSRMTTLIAAEAVPRN
jgi:hypothetical protein